MSRSITGMDDGAIGQVLRALSQYGGRHPDARIEAHRQNSVSVRVRIIDPDFEGINRSDRHEIIWKFLEGLPEEVQSQVSLLLLLTPQEMAMSVANFEFDNPIPSNL